MPCAAEGKGGLLPAGLVACCCSPRLPRLWSGLALGAPDVTSGAFLFLFPTPLVFRSLPPV
eukprot:4775058-Pyramimonas_sp.AAC.1